MTTSPSSRSSWVAWRRVPSAMPSSAVKRRSTGSGVFGGVTGFDAALARRPPDRDIAEFDDLPSSPTPAHASQPFSSLSATFTRSGIGMARTMLRSNASRRGRQATASTRNPSPARSSPAPGRCSMACARCGDGPCRPGDARHAPSSSPGRSPVRPQEANVRVPSRLTSRTAIITGAAGGLGKASPSAWRTKAPRSRPSTSRPTTAPPHPHGPVTSPISTRSPHGGGSRARVGGVDILLNNAGLLSGRKWASTRQPGAVNVGPRVDPGMPAPDVLLYRSSA